MLEAMAAHPPSEGSADGALPPSLLERALAAAGEGVVIADARLPDMPLIYVNPAFEAVTGYSREEALGRNCRFLQGQGTDPAALVAIRTALAERRGVVVELLNYRKDGVPFWNRLTITPVHDATGEVTHFIGVQSDVTERRLAQDRLAAANRQMRRDLEAAAKIQMSLLPRGIPAVAGVQVAWTFRPCRELAGDMLNVVPLGEDRLGFFILDVSGHGVPAALLSFTLAHTMTASAGHSFLLRLQDTAWVPTPPALVTAELNRRFPLDPVAPQFFTIFYGVLTPACGQLWYASAGHPLAVLSPVHGAPRRLPATGPPIGVSETATFGAQVLQLEAGDRVVLFTDGLTEALSPQGEELGFERVLEAIVRLRLGTLDELAEGLAGEGSAWTKGELQDDISVLAVELARPMGGGG